MKRFILLITAILLFSTLNVLAKDSELLNSREVAKQDNQISEIGFKILNANAIPYRTVFTYDTARTINAYSQFNNRKIVMYRGMYNRCDTEDELAAILAHEISHSVDSYQGPLRGSLFFVNYMVAPRKYESKADKRAIDYMVNAGYHPVAMIVAMSKNFPQGRYEVFSSHPLATRRMMEVYEYIYKKYPEYLVDNKYRKNIYYQNFLLTSKENREKFQEKVKSNSNKKIRYK